MDDDLICEITRKLEQIDYIIICVFKDLDAGNIESASIGLSVAVDYLEELKRTLGKKA